MRLGLKEVEVRSIQQPRLAFGEELQLLVLVALVDL